MKNLEINAKNTMEVITIEELLDSVATGKICLPEYQRPAVWTDEQVRLLADTVKNGLPYGVLSVAEITNEEGNVKRLLIDGHQRRTALAKICQQMEEKIDSLLLASDEMARAGKMEEVAELEDDIKKAEADKMEFLSSEVVLEVAKLTITEAAQMFVRLNNGKALSGIQKGTAKINSAVLAKARSYINLLPDKVAGKKAKDEVALMLAAAMVDIGNKGYNCKNMSTSGATAIRVLENADPAKMVDAGKMEETCKAFINAVTKAARQTEWFAAARMVPAMVAGYVFHISEGEWSAMFDNLEKVNGWKPRTDKPAKVSRVKGVELYDLTTCKVKEAETFSNIWSETSNSPKATLARFSSLRDVFRPTKDRIAGHPLYGNGEVVEVTAEDTEALVEAAKAMKALFTK